MIRKNKESRLVCVMCVVNEEGKRKRGLLINLRKRAKMHSSSRPPGHTASPGTSTLAGFEVCHLFWA